MLHQLLKGQKMIPRYTRLPMSAIWSLKNKYKIWFETEALAAAAMAKQGQIPQEAADDIRKKGEAFILNLTDEDIKQIAEIEKETRHDVIAFLTKLGEIIGPSARFLHLGMTSSDIIDTTLSIQLKQSADILLQDLDDLLAALKKQAFEHKFTLTIGRSHGIHAEPTTFGLKMANHYAEFARNRERLLTARKEISVCAVSGAVGTFAHLDPEVEIYVADHLELTPETVSTQVIPRDRHAAFFSTLAVIAASVERLATEIRHLQRSEVREAEEFFHAGQKGSSAMPHKRNPVLSENLTGLSRIVRSAVIPALEDVTLWHERDISHSSVERVIAPDTTTALDFALHRLASLTDRLVVSPGQMLRNLNALGGVIYSGEVLLSLARSGISREEAYQIVQRNAMKVWEALNPPEGEAASPLIAGKTGSEAFLFYQYLSADPAVTVRLSPEALAQAFKPDSCLKKIDYIFERVFGEKGPVLKNKSFSFF